MSRIFTPKKVIKYAQTRLFGSNVRPDDVKSFGIYNGFLESQLRELATDAFGGFIEVIQKNPREQLYFSDGHLLIPQYSSFERGERYETMIRRYIEATGSFKSLAVLDAGGNRRVTYIHYDNHAYDFVTGMFVPEKKYENRRVFPTRDITGLSTIIIGPLEAVARQATILEKGTSEYLDAQIIDIEGRKALNIGYVYGCQGGIIINKMMREYAAMAAERSQKRQVDVFMFGRVGALAKDAKRHDIVHPASIIDWADLERGTPMVHPMGNILADGQPEDMILNVHSVLDETTEQLDSGRSFGCTCVEMETRDIVDAIDQANRRHHNELDVRFGFVGHVSDIPLEGDTLEKELDSDRGEQAAVAEIVSTIRNMQ